MAQTKLHNELVEPPDGKGYYQVTVRIADKSDEGTATLPDGIGRVTVYKENYRYPEPHQSFAWKIRKS